MKLTINEQERAALEQHGEWCFAMAKSCMERNGLNFDDVERINDHFETHRCGSNADRRYRTAAVNKAVRKVGENPAAYIA